MMDFSLSEDEQAVSEAAAKLAADSDPWRALAAGGWLDLLATEPSGALGYLGLVAEELGAAGVALPLPGTAALWPTLFAESAGGRRVGVVEGDLAEDGVGADLIVVLTDHRAAAYETFSVEPVGELEGDQLARVTVHGPPLAECADALRIEDACRLATALIAAEMAGAIRRVVDMTTTYVSERHQFGRPLSSFQVIQHGAARLATLAEAATWTARLACADPTAEHVHAAKGWLSAAAVEVSALAHQLHGATGFTEEYGLQCFTKRLRTLRFAWGDDPSHYRALGRLRAMESAS
jgi:acyl-CoA dehydrogenase